ncbi:hypothetical protein U9M48_017558 [Paspalum notatum var. saurae]|uniref:Plus3 domain-containing protein n=1 Tax=Paspalum notatum var. saurae TaxID=547442 RepID=A0AAQ3T7P2_PASNO
MSPLSELVWSPDEGLSIKIAASSLSTRKTSLQWNADTLSIVISSPQQSGAGGTKSGDNICDNLVVSEKMPSQLRTCNDSSSARITMASPNRITNFDALQSTSMGSQEQGSKCLEGINLMNEGKEGLENCCVDKPEDLELGGFLARYCKDASHVYSYDNCQDPILQESQKDEPVVARAESASGINAFAKCESAHGVNARKLEKGKEKVIYNNSHCVSNTKESDDSNESIESCPSTKAPKRKHAQCSAASMPSRKKRCSREDNGSSCSGLFQKCGTSFFNWMSSLTNGLTMLDEATAAVPLDQKLSTTTGEGSVAPPLPLQNSTSIPMQSVGFNSLFKSLYSHNVMITSTNTCPKPENNSCLDKQIGMGRETLDMATQTLASERLQMNSNVDKEMNDIQHFTGKGSSHGATSSKCPVMPPEESKQSETMASVFAKRLDALRHAKTSAVQLAIACDHGTSKRSNHKSNSFVVSYSSHDEPEVGQETHKSSSGNGRIVLWVGDKGKEQLCAQSNEELGGNSLSDSKHRHHGESINGKSAIPQNNLDVNTLGEDIDRRRVELKGGVSDFVAGLSDNKQIVPYGIMCNDVCDGSSVVFGALHKLRLSRSNIIRWLRSPIMHTTLDGFFVRLRFGKWEEALGGTGYHVARLNGAQDRNRLSVTIRNSTCQVDSRFVSNHDFHEDELKAWWSAATKGSGTEMLSLMA